MRSDVCPDCKTPLENLHCSGCQSAFSSIDGIPVLLSKRPEFQKGSGNRSYSRFALFRRQQCVGDTWAEHGGIPHLLHNSAPPASESVLPGNRMWRARSLAAVQAGEKAAVDLFSAEAIKVARTKTQGEFSVALAEALPFKPEQFDLILSVGVMEHFVDQQRAFQEIRRVLKPGGHFLSLIDVRLTFLDRVTLKIPHLFFSPTPWPSPVFARWLGNKLSLRPVPNRQDRFINLSKRMYSTQGGKACFERNGFRVIDVIHTDTVPDLPLKDIHVVIYIGEK